MSGSGGFRGRGFNQRGHQRPRSGGRDSPGGSGPNSCNDGPNSRSRGSGYKTRGRGSSRGPCPNFNLPRRPPPIGIRPTENWSPRGGPPHFPAWRGPRPPRFNGPPRPFFPHRGQSPYQPRFPFLPPGNNFQPALPAIPVPETKPVDAKPSIPHLGSEEERKQKITEAADALKRKLSVVATEPEWWRDDDDVGLDDPSRDDDRDSRIVHMGIPELKHDPPELNLTVGDLRDIGRVDHDHRIETPKTNSPNDENFTSDDSEIKILAHNPVRTAIEIDLWSDDNLGEHAIDTAEVAATIDDSASRVDDSASRVDDSASRVDDSASCVDDTASRVDDTASRVDDIATSDASRRSDRTDDIAIPATEPEESPTEATIERPNETPVEFDARESELVRKTDENNSGECDNVQNSDGIDSNADKTAEGDNNAVIPEETVPVECISVEERETTTEIPTEIVPENSNGDTTESPDDANESNVNEITTKLEASNSEPEVTEAEKIIETTKESWPLQNNSASNDFTNIPGLDGLFVNETTENPNVCTETKNDERSDVDIPIGSAIVVEKIAENDVTDPASGVETAIVGEEIKEPQKESTSKNLDITDMRHSEICKNSDSRTESAKDNRKDESCRQIQDATSKPVEDRTKGRSSSGSGHRTDTEARPKGTSTKIDNATVRERRDERDDKTRNKLSDERSKDRHKSENKEKSRSTHGRNKSEKSETDKPIIGKNTDSRDKTRASTKSDHSREKSESSISETSGSSSSRRRKTDDHEPENRESLSSDRKNDERRKPAMQKHGDPSSSKNRSRESPITDVPLNFDPWAPPPMIFSNGQQPVLPPVPAEFNPNQPPPKLVANQDTVDGALLPPAFDPRISAHDRSALMVSGVQDYAVNPSYIPQNITNFPPIGPVINYVQPPIIGGTGVDPTGNIQPIRMNDPYTPLLSLPNVPIAAPIGITADNSLLPPLPVPPPPPVPPPGKTGLDMDDGLEDMQEAMEFAKQFMNMDPRSPIDEINSDDVNFFHMPTFPDLPPFLTEDIPRPPFLTEDIPRPPSVAGISDRNETIFDEDANKCKTKKKEDVVYGPQIDINFDDEAKDENLTAIDGQLRPKVMFNLSSKTKIISKENDWQQRQHREKSVEPVPAVTFAVDTSEFEKNWTSNRTSLDTTVRVASKEQIRPSNGQEERKEHRTIDDKNDGKISKFNGVNFEIGKLEKCPTSTDSGRTDINPRRSTRESTSRKTTDDTPEASWKSRVIGRFLKMSKNDICNMLNNTGLRKFDIAMKHLVKERRSSLSLGLRNSEEEKLRDPEATYNRDEFMDQLSAMLDPSATVDVCNLPTQFIHHLSEVLQLDSVLEFDGTLTPSENVEAPASIPAPQSSASRSPGQAAASSSPRQAPSLTPPPKPSSLTPPPKPSSLTPPPKPSSLTPPRPTTQPAPRLPKESAKVRENDDRRTSKRLKEKTIAPDAAATSVATISPVPKPEPRRVAQPCELTVESKCPPKIVTVVSESQKNSTTSAPRPRRRQPHHMAIADNPETPAATANGFANQEDSGSLNMADLDDIFSAGIARAKKKIVHPSNQEKLVGELDNDAISRGRPSNADPTVAKDPCVDGAERAAVELDKIFTAGIAKAKLASMQAAAAAAKATEAAAAKAIEAAAAKAIEAAAAKAIEAATAKAIEARDVDAADDDDDDGWKIHADRKSNEDGHRSRHRSSTRHMTKCEKWNRRMAREDPDAFRNLTKEEWEAKYGETSNSTYEREYRAMVGTKTRRTGRSPTSSKDSHEGVVREETRGVMARLGSIVTGDSGPAETWSDSDDDRRIRNTQDSADFPTGSREKYDDGGSTSSGSSTATTSESSEDEDPDSPSVTKLLKVIKAREKIGRKRTVNEEIRDEVTAEMERKRRDREKISRKGHRSKTKKGHRRKKDKRVKVKDRKKRDKKKKKRKSRRIGMDEEARSESDGSGEEAEGTSSLPRHRRCRRILTEAEIKKEVDDDVVVKDEPVGQPRPKSALGTKAPDDSRPPSTSSTSLVPASVGAPIAALPSSVQPTKTKAQLKQLPALPKNVAATPVPRCSNEIPKKAVTPIKEVSKENTNKIVASSISKNASTAKTPSIAQITSVAKTPSIVQITSIAKNASLAKIASIAKTVSIPKTASIVNPPTNSSHSATAVSASPSPSIEPPSITNDGSSPVSSKSAKKLDMSAYKERTKIRLLRESEKLRLIDENPSSLTQNLLNIPLTRKKIVDGTAKVVETAKQSADPRLMKKVGPSTTNATISMPMNKATSTTGAAKSSKVVDGTATATNVSTATRKNSTVGTTKAEIPKISSTTAETLMICAANPPTIGSTNVKSSAIGVTSAKTSTISATTGSTIVSTAATLSAPRTTDSTIPVIGATTGNKIPTIVTTMTAIPIIVASTISTATVTTDPTGNAARDPVAETVAGQQPSATTIPARRLIRRRTVTNVADDPSSMTEARVEAGKFAHIKSEGSKELKLREKLKRGRHRVTSEALETTIPPIQGPRTTKRPIAAQPTNTEVTAGLSVDGKIEETPISQPSNYFKKGLPSDGFPDIVPRETLPMFDDENSKIMEIIQQKSEPDSLDLPISELSGWPFGTPIATSINDDIDVEDSPPFKGFAEETILRQDRVLTEAKITSEIEALDPLPVAFETGSDALPTSDVVDLNVPISYDAEEFVADTAEIETTLLGFAMTNDIPVDSVTIDDLGHDETIPLIPENTAETISREISESRGSVDIDPGAITTLANLSPSSNFFITEVPQRDSIPSPLLVTESATDGNPSDLVATDLPTIDTIEKGTKDSGVDVGEVTLSREIQNTASDAVNVETTERDWETSNVTINDVREDEKNSFKTGMVETRVEVEPESASGIRNDQERKPDNDDKTVVEPVSKDSNAGISNATPSSNDVNESRPKQISTDKERGTSETPDRETKSKERSRRGRSKSRERSHAKTTMKKSSRHHNHRRDGKKKSAITEKMVEEALSSNIVKIVSMPTNKDTVMARMIEIDVEIHKLMNEKMTLYKMLESGNFPVGDESEVTTSGKTNAETKTTRETLENSEIPAPKVLASRLVRDLDKNVISARATKHVEISKKSDAKKNETEDANGRSKRKKSPQRECVKNRTKDATAHVEGHRRRKMSESKTQSRRTTSEESTRTDTASAHSREKSTSSTDHEDAEEKSQKRKSESLPRRSSPKRSREHSSHENHGDGSRDNAERSPRSAKSENSVRDVAKIRPKKKPKIAEDNKIGGTGKTTSTKKSKNVARTTEKIGTSGKKICGDNERGLIYSDESTWDSTELDAIGGDEPHVKTDGSTSSKGLALLEESFKREIAQTRRLKAMERRKNKKQELRRVLLESGYFATDEKESLRAATEVNRSINANKNSDKVWEHVTDIIEAVAEGRIEPGHNDDENFEPDDSVARSSIVESTTTDEKVEKNVSETVEEATETAVPIEKESDALRNPEKCESVSNPGGEPMTKVQDALISSDAGETVQHKNIIATSANISDDEDVQKMVEDNTGSRDNTSKCDKANDLVRKSNVESVEINVSNDEVAKPAEIDENCEKPNAGMENSTDTTANDEEVRTRGEEEVKKDTGKNVSPIFDKSESIAAEKERFNGKESKDSRSSSPDATLRNATMTDNENREPEEEPHPRIIEKESHQRSTELAEETSVIGRSSRNEETAEIENHRSKSRNGRSKKDRNAVLRDVSSKRKRTNDAEKHSSSRAEDVDVPLEKTSIRPRSATKRKSEKSMPPSRQSSRYSEDGGKKSRRRKRDKSMSRESSTNDREPPTKRRNHSRGSSSPFVRTPVDDEQTPRRGRKRKARPELTRYEMTRCKVLLIDCKYTYMSPNMHPKILKKLGISKINPYRPPNVVERTATLAETIRAETPSPPILSKAEISKDEEQPSPFSTEPVSSPIEHPSSPRERASSPFERETFLVGRPLSSMDRSSSPGDAAPSPTTAETLLSSPTRVYAFSTAIENRVDVDEDDDDDETIQIVKVADENLAVIGQSEDDEEEEAEVEEEEAEQDDEEVAANVVEDMDAVVEESQDVLEETEAVDDAVEEPESVPDLIEKVENVADVVQESAAPPDSTEDVVPVDDAHADETSDEKKQKTNSTENNDVTEKRVLSDDEPTVIEVLPDPEAEDEDVEPRRTRYTVHKGPILDIKVLDDSFLAASEDGAIYRYSQKSNGILNIYKGHEAAVTCIYVLEAVGKCWKLFSGSLDGTFRCYDITTGLQERSPAIVGSPVQCMDQAWGVIFVGTKSGHISRYNIKSGSIKGDRLEFSDKSVLALKASAEGPRRVLIVASRNQPITIRDALTGLFLRTICGYKNHTVYSLMRERNLVYCGTSSTSIPVFDFTNGEQITQYNAGVGIVCMRLYRQILFAGCYDGNIYVFDTKGTKLICSIPGPGNMLLSMEIVDDEIIAGSKNRQLHSWRMPRQVRALLSERT